MPEADLELKEDSPGAVPPDPVAPSPRRRRWPAVAAVAVAAAGAVLGLTTSGGGPAAARVVGGNVPLNPSASDRLDVSAHNSPALRANPRDPANLVEAERVDTPVVGCAVRVTFDGGSTWSAVPISLPEGEQLSCFSPDLAFGADGRLAIVFTTFSVVQNQGIAPDGLWLATSADGGRTFSAAHRVAGELAFQARLAADPSEPGRLWLAWLQGSVTASGNGLSSTNDPILVARSDDGGATWGTPVAASGKGRARVVAPVLAAGAGGALVLAYLDVGDDRLDYTGAHEGIGGEPYGGPWTMVVAKSGDLGATWRETALAPALVPTRRFRMVSPPAPALAVDAHRHRAYVAFQDGGEASPDVVLWRSTDEGGTWSRAVRVNDTARHDGTSQYLPALAVAPDGRLDVVYYDRRTDHRDITTSVSLQSSFDGARSFSPHVVLSDRGFDSGIGPGAAQDMAELGDRLALASTDRAVLALWTDTRGGNRQTGKQDVARAVAVVRAPSRLRPWLHGGGLAMAALGVLGLVAAVVGGRRAPQPVAGPPPG